MLLCYGIIPLGMVMRKSYDTYEHIQDLFVVSSWFNAIILFVYLKNKNLFNFNELFFAKLIKILLASIIMGIFFNYLILFFENKLLYEYNFKSFYLILLAFLSLIFYLSFSLFIKAFKYGDIKLKY